MQSSDLNAHLDALADHLQPQPARERRRHRRVPLSIAGTMLDSRGQEHDFHIIDASVGGLRIRTDARCMMGEKVILYCQAIGRLSGAVQRKGDGELAIAMTLTALKKDKLIEALTWQINKDALQLEETRRAERFNATGEVACKLSNGRVLRCQVLDISVLGMSLMTAEKRPMIGELVTVGRHTGTVARYTEKGFAVDFANGLKAGDPLD
jgi:hypothetical protein